MPALIWFLRIKGALEKMGIGVSGRSAMVWVVRTDSSDSLGTSPLTCLSEGEIVNPCRVADHERIWGKILSKSESVAHLGGMWILLFSSGLLAKGKRGQNVHLWACQKEKCCPFFIRTSSRGCFFPFCLSWYVFPSDFVAVATLSQVLPLLVTWRITEYFIW